MIFLAAFLVVFLAFAIWLLPAIKFFGELKSSKAACSSKTQSIANCDVQSFRCENPRATLIIVPGLHPSGIHDRRFQAFAKACASAGFYVLAPDIEEFRNFRITPASVQIIVQLIEELSANARKNVGVLGISYALGPVFAAAAKTKINFIVGIGGFYTLEPALRFTITGRRNEQHTRRKSQSWGRLVLISNLVDRISPPADKELLNEIVWALLKSDHQKADGLSPQLSEAGKKVLDEILNGPASDDDSKLLEIIPIVKQLSSEVSPSVLVNEIDPKVRFYLLHGISDNIIPFEETEDLTRELRKRNHAVRTCITNSLTHVDPVHRLTDAWGLLKLLIWTRRLISEASR